MVKIVGIDFLKTRNFWDSPLVLRGDQIIDYNKSNYKSFTTHTHTHKATPISSCEIIDSL